MKRYLHFAMSPMTEAFALIEYRTAFFCQEGKLDNLQEAIQHLQHIKNTLLRLQYLTRLLSKIAALADASLIQPGLVGEGSHLGRILIVKETYSLRYP